jgi:hypothetical protein
LKVQPMHLVHSLISTSTHQPSRTLEGILNLKPT